ncbi:hypothetical protein HC776_01635 [bacterium]|nr:hypothetical protein [bacterium]
MHLFLSPHYDDAVYSCGGLIAQLTRNRHTARVYTVMGAKPPQTPPDTPIIRELHARWQAGADPVKARRSEDETALYLLNAEVGYNNAIPDCIYRTAHGGRALYTDIQAIFGAVDADDPSLVALELKLPTAHQLWQSIQFDADETPRFIPNDPAGVTLYAPLGVGHHVDHQIVRDWAFKLHRTYPTLTLMLYEDFPYIRQPQHIAPTLTALPVGVTAQVQPLDESAIQLKMQAIAAYATQLDSFWADRQAMMDDVRETLMQRGQGTPSEVLYRVS